MNIWQQQANGKNLPDNPGAIVDLPPLYFHPQNLLSPLEKTLLYSSAQSHGLALNGNQIHLVPKFYSGCIGGVLSDRVGSGVIVPALSAKEPTPVSAFQRPRAESAVSSSPCLKRRFIKRKVKPPGNTLFTIKAMTTPMAVSRMRFRA